MSLFCWILVVFVEGLMRKEVKSNGVIRKINYLWGLFIYGIFFFYYCG